MNIAKVKIERLPSGRFCIRDTDGEYFYNGRSDIRTYTRASSAITFLRRTGYTWCVKMPNGAARYVNYIDLTEFGPHSWMKKNIVTIVDDDGIYDVWKCKLCEKETRRYGLQGRPWSGACEGNPQEEAEV